MGVRVGSGNEVVITNGSATKVAPAEYNADQIQLLKNTVAKGATDDEFKLFLYRCRAMELDPLKPGQIHFVKYGTGAGSIVVGIDGFRSKAARTRHHTGTKRGIIRDDKGKCIGAWAEIYRSDWQHPAREEVSLAEYNTGRNNWARMPETMIKKVAEVAALRMAFPDDLGGVYSDDEMAQQHTEPASQTEALPPAPPMPIQTVAPVPLAPLSEKQLKRLYAISREHCWAPEEVKAVIKDHFGKASSKELSWAEYDGLCKHIELNSKRLPFEEPQASDVG